jgi:hydrogenase expression/formation protein HypD
MAFGDMLRVPVNAPKKSPRTLEQAKAAGADIRPVASPLDVVEFARSHPERQVVFFAAGFETTSAPVAAMLVEGVPDNLSVLLSGRLTWPAVNMLLESDIPGFDALIAPGHVATVMGPEEWSFVPERFRIPAAIAGFSAESLLAAMYSVLRQLLEGKAFLDNCYPELVRENGNPAAKRHLRAAFEVSDANWRGIGVIPGSGFALRDAYLTRDAHNRYPSYADDARKRVGQMPPGCDCAAVVLGRIYPDQCRLYGSGCNPRHPIGPCMVSDEGACRIWWASGVRENRNNPKSRQSVAAVP